MYLCRELKTGANVTCFPYLKPALAAGGLTRLCLGSVKQAGHFSGGSRNSASPCGGWQWNSLATEWDEELGARGNPCYHMDSAGQNSGLASALHLVSSIPLASLAELHTMPVHAAVRSWILVIALGISTTLPHLSSVLPAQRQLAHLSEQIL